MSIAWEPTLEAALARAERERRVVMAEFSKER